MAEPTGEIRPGFLRRERLERPYGGWEAPELPSNPTLALCESAAEVARLAQGGPRYDGLVALTAQAACECHLQSIPYLKLEDFYDARALLEADEPMLALQAAWTDAIDAFAWEALPELAEAGVRPAGHCFLQLKVLVDRLYQAAFGLAHLLIAAGPARVLHFAERRRGSVPDTLLFGGPIYASVLPGAARIYGSEAVALSAIARRTGVPLRDRGPRGAFESVLGPRLTGELVALRHSGFAGLGLARASGGPEVVYQAPAYDLLPTAEQLASRGYAPVTLREALPPRPLAERRGQVRMRRSLAALWPQLLSSEFLAEPFQWAGLDLLPLAESRLRHWWLRLVPSMWRAYSRSRTRFAGRRPEALLLYSPVTPEEHGAVQAARAAGIPTITYQHGGFEGNCEYVTYEMTDLRLADHRLVYGDGTAAYMRERARRLPDPRPRIASVGSARLDAVRPVLERRGQLRSKLGMTEGEPAILYLASSYQHRSWYICRGSYMQVPYFELLAGVVEAAARHPGVRFVYKPFPEHPSDPVAELIEAKAPNMTVVRDVPATDLFAACDGLVIDIPSTALLEAMLTRKRLLVHADSRFVELRPEARELLLRRARLSEGPDALIEELEALASDELSELAEPDESFLRAYGTHLGDERSAERAADAVTDIAAASGRVGTAPAAGAPVESRAS